MAGNRHCNIRFKGEWAGTLEERPDGSTLFAYNPGWETDIACALPARTSTHPWPRGPHPVFQHLTAEGWLRAIQTGAGQVDAEDDLGLLLSHGGDCIGALSVHPDGDAKVPVPMAPTSVEAAALAGGRTVSGVQRKVMAIRDGTGYSPALAGEPAPFIAKWSAQHADLVRNERLTLELARMLLGAGAVTRCEVAEVETVGTCLVVTRFDRTKRGEKLRLEDFAQILARPRAGDAKYDADHEAIGAAIQTHSARPAQDLLAFLKLTVTNVLLGNCDAHLKNFSLLETPAGLRLSPAYDVVNTLMYREYGTRFALRIDGAHHPIDSIGRDRLAGLGHGIGLPPAAVTLAFRDLGRAAKKVVQTLRDRAANEHEPGFLARYEEIVSANALRIFPDG